LKITQLPVNVLIVPPVPLSETVCGLPGALSFTESVPVTVPTAVGVKVTLMVQFAAEARLEPQLSFSPKFPVAAMLEMSSAAVP